LTDGSVDLFDAGWLNSSERLEAEAVVVAGDEADDDEAFDAIVDMDDMNF
jgi:hypothetical protein